MRPPAKIKDWLTVQKMYNWLQNAPDKEAYKRRHAIWLTHTDQLHAQKVAEILDVSIQAVWLWISQYNKFGPEGLQRKGRGGRRRAFFSHQEEREILKPFLQKARSGNPPKTNIIKAHIEDNLRRKVSKAYIYKLLQRHRWASIIAQSNLKQASLTQDESFERFYQPWRKKP